MNKKLWLMLPVAAILSSCQTWGPTWSEVTGARYTRTEMYRLPSSIERVDDQGSFASNPIKITPGVHEIQVSGTLRGWPGANLQMMKLDAQPCMRYYINNQYQNFVDPNYTPVIDYAETIAGCRVPTA